MSVCICLFTLRLLMQRVSVSTVATVRRRPGSARNLDQLERLDEIRPAELPGENGLWMTSRRRFSAPRRCCGSCAAQWRGVLVCSGVLAWVLARTSVTLYTVPFVRSSETVFHSNDSFYRFQLVPHSSFCRMFGLRLSVVNAVIQHSELVFPIFCAFELTFVK
jgi:hypothetical protein